ncbi:BREX-2 system adenine-specific DNA-methyltransferase PglX [uncultured Lamprocystis sp.]|uniref:BREX-2 system adenine-specific DNA-methyltransferase PglX n=1 Tax=uncultured Lamprocystis sp. TaxID=543132 RepID=UPI0025CD8A62|nr:BREX-2 system adenine-specific DNA-methyltransferase PglX [uncultured Lamprocystis sp.]
MRKRYALLQTPEFVERFILDYTLEPALRAFGLPGLKLIDPTCGSGHFLLTGFERLFADWQQREPATNARALAQRALDAIHGVDINPYAIAIARFRLLIAAMKAAGSDRIKDAPDFHFNLAVGDSLLHGRRHEWQGQGNQRDLLDDSLAHVFEVEDRDKLERILGQRYQVVVGNPPYITVKDKALNQAIRDKYLTCHRQYSLGVPFTERFFDLTLPAEDNRPAGFVGMITANSFMKREFGKKLIEEYLPRKDLTHVIDTSGAYVPGHGTPTVILFGRNRTPQGDLLRAVLGIRGEPSTPEDAAQGLVWRSIVDLLERPGSESEFVSVVDQERGLYARHPWSVGGGGAVELQEVLDQESKKTLDDVSLAIGFVCITKQDDVFVQDSAVLARFGVDQGERKPFGIGEEVRDWAHTSPLDVLFPYRNDLTTRVPQEFATALRFMWPYREDLYSRKVFCGQTYREAGKPWYEFGQIPVERYKIPLSITFAFVATHNHFVLDRGGKVFKQSAPVIKLPAGASEDDHLALLGLLNSSTACFWMKQVLHSKGGGGIGGGLASEEWEQFYEHTGTGLKEFPVPSAPKHVARDRAQQLDQLAQQITALDPAAVLSRTPENPKTALAEAEHQSDALWHQMIALQEELDWLNYRLYGLSDEDLCLGSTPPEIRLGERPFEIALARHLAAGETQTTWFARHNSTPITEIPAHWPADYRALTERRLQAMADNPWIHLIEQPEYKRRWNREPWESRLRRALRDWLLDHLEALCHAPELLTVAQLAERARHDAAFQQVAALYTGSDTFDARTLVGELVEGDQVPQMAAARYKRSAMPKFHAWRETWDKQRAEDAIDARVALDPADPQSLTAEQARALKAQEIGDIPLPPKYAATDFRKPSYWGLRGKLDVPKERFFSLPGCERSGDSTLVIGWAGLDHLQRAQAIATWYLERKEQDGWDAERLMPMLVALDELIPWLKQWHNALDPELGERLGDYYEGFLLEELRHLDLSRDALSDWEPAAPARGRRRTG